MAGSQWGQQAEEPGVTEKDQRNAAGGGLEIELRVPCDQGDLATSVE
jgi:hypothetical protein